MLPYLTSNIKKKRKSISKFYGINKDLHQSDGELYSSRNMSGADFPALSVRKTRGAKNDTGVSINGAGYKNSLYYTGKPSEGNETRIYCGSSSAVLSSDSELSPSVPRQFAALEDSILIIPDNKVYTVSENSVYNIEYSKSITLEEAREKALRECNETIIANMPMYIGEITSQGIISSYYSHNRYTSYFMPFTDIKDGDIVHISMDVHPENATQDIAYANYVRKMQNGFDAKVTGVKKRTHSVAGKEGSITEITEVYFGENAIDMGGYDEVTISSITLSRRMPQLDYICTLNNRVWGVHGNTICCSKLGDCSKWYDYSSDSFGTLPSSSYSANVDSNGDFTAVTPFCGSIIAFKENCMHKIYGNDPDSYTISTQNCRGVKSGAANTVAVIGSSMYYVACDGVYEYSGIMPEKISQKLNLDGLEPVCAGTDGKSYFLILSSGAEKIMYVYYPEHRIWHREDVPSNASILTGNGNTLYLICKTQIIALGEDNPSEKTEWSFSIRFDDLPYAEKGYGKLFIRYSLEKGAQFCIKTVCDGNSQLAYITGAYEKNLDAHAAIPLPFIGCNGMIAEFYGSGGFTLNDITSEFTVGADKTENL